MTTINRKSPYQGLDAYQAEDADFFFGRERDTRLIIASLFASPFTVLYGASGVGKSSVLRAGAVSELRRRQDLFVVVFNYWQIDPMRELLACIDKAARAISLQVVPTQDPTTLADYLEAITAQSGRRIMMIFDQFEEYFLYQKKADADGQFFQQFPDVVRRKELPASFLVSIREDCLAKLDCFEGLIPNLLDNNLRIEHLNRQDAGLAIIKPIEMYNELFPGGSHPTGIEPELVEAVLNDVLTGAVILGGAGCGTVATEVDSERGIETPYLQLVMTRLWETEVRNQSAALRLETFQGLGRAETIVREHLDSQMENFSDSEKEIAASVFHHLVTPSGTKIAHTVGDLAEWAEMTNRIDEVRQTLEELADGKVRILKPVGSLQDGRKASRFEIYHDALAPAILHWRFQYCQAQQEQQAKILADEEHRRLHMEGEVRAAKRLRRANWALAGAGLAVLVFAILAYVQYKQAYREEHQAHSLRLSALARAQLRVDAESALKLALQGVQETRSRKMSASPEVLGILHEAFLSSRAVQTLEGHTDEVIAVAFSPDGKYLASAGKDHRAILWDAKSFLEVRTFSGLESSISGLVFSPDSRLLATVGADGTVVLWNLQSEEKWQLPQENDEGFLCLAFSHEGKQLVGGSDAGRITIWDIASHKVEHSYSDPESQTPVVTVAFGRDGKQLLLGNKDGAVILWDISGGVVTKQLAGYSSPVLTVAFHAEPKRMVSVGEGSWGPLTHFYDLSEPEGKQDRLRLLLTGEVNTACVSPDGRWLAVAGNRGIIHVSQAFTDESTFAKDVFMLGKSQGPVRALAFSRDGNRLASGSADGAVRIWDISRPDVGVELLGGNTRLRDLVFAQDGNRIASAGEDGRVRVWDRKTMQELNTFTPESGLLHLAINSDGRRVAVAVQRDNRVEVWDTVVSDRAASAKSEEGRSGITEKGALKQSPPNKPEPVYYSQHVELVADLAFSPDGKWLATASWDHTVKILDAVSGEEKGILVHPAAVTAVAFQPGVERRVVTGTANGEVRIWDASRVPDLPATASVRAHEGAIRDIAFSPDGKQFATAGDDKLVRVWSAASHAQRGPDLVGYADAVVTVAFSQDGKRLATGSKDGSVKVWDLASGQVAIIFPEYSDEVVRVSFTPDGKRLAVATRNQELRLYLVDEQELFARASERIGRRFRVDECTLYKIEAPECATAQEIAAAAEMARNGDIPAARDQARQALQQEARAGASPAWGFDVNRWTNRWAAQARIQEGRVQGGRGDLDRSEAEFNKAKKLDSSLNLNPTQMGRNLVAEWHYRQGIILARMGQVDKAMGSLQKAADLQAKIPEGPRMLAKRTATEAYVAKSFAHVREGRVDDALSALEQAAQFVPSRNYQVEGQRIQTNDGRKLLVATKLIVHGRELAGQGEIDKALEAFSQAKPLLPPTKFISASAWNTLCWQGTLNDAAAKVIAACEEAVKLEPGHGGIRDSRGLARAQIGDIQGAIEDFQAFIDWQPQNPVEKSPEQVEQRRQWVAALRAGKNPSVIFTPEVLDALRRQ